MALIFLDETSTPLQQSLFGVIEHLRMRRQSAKLKLYTQFSVVLGASAVFAVAWSIYGIVRSSEKEAVRMRKRMAIHLLCPTVIGLTLLHSLAQRPHEGMHAKFQIACDLLNDSSLKMSAAR